MTTDTRPATDTRTPALRIREHARHRPGAVALRDKHFGVWRPWTWAHYWDQVELFGHALLALGVQPGDRVGIHSENRPEWLVADMGALAVRAASVGLYPTNPAAEVGYLLADSGAVVLVAEDQEQVDKALEVIGDCPDLRSIVYLEPRGIRGRYDDPRLLSWDDAPRPRRPAPRRARRRGRPTWRRPRSPTTSRRSSTPPAPPARPRAPCSPSPTWSSRSRCCARTAAFTDPPPGPCRPGAVVPAAVHTWPSASSPRGSTPPAPPRSTSPSRSTPCRRTCARCSRPSSSASPASGRSCWPASRPGCRRRIVGQAGRHPLLARSRREHRRHAREHRRPAHARHPSRVRRGLAVLLPLPHRADRHAAGPVRRRPAPLRSRPRCCKFFMGIGVPMHEAYGMTENSAVATATGPGRVRLGTVGEPHEGIEVRIDERPARS